MTTLKETVSFLKEQNTDLLNRIQSADFKTYAAMKSLQEVPEIPDVLPKTDINELRALGEAQGLGDTVYDLDGTDYDEFTDTLLELGVKPKQQ